MRLIDISPYEIGAMSCSVQTTKQESATTMSVTQTNTNTIPTVDATPVVHGEWINRRSHMLQEYKECSVCGNITDDYIMSYIGDGRFGKTDPNYCHNCGAKMDGGNDAEET